MLDTYTKEELQDVLWEAYKMDRINLGDLTFEEFNSLSEGELQCLIRGASREDNTEIILKVVSP